MNAPKSARDDGTPLSWASDSGQDEHGVFADIKVGEAVQRMRWIPSGTFLRGSPKSEEHRAPEEGPVHTVKLTRGFWLADTPCTQALWMEVMDENPSRFVSPDRPVDKVSWDATQLFFEKAEAQHPGLGLRLPTEAQWEYACRAGTETPIWLGELKILGAHNAPQLDEIAWYGGNSGVDFDLPRGEKSSDWKERQYPHEVAGTRAVGLKAPNPWGLYDMLGNVWEWCTDNWRFEPYNDEEWFSPSSYEDSPEEVRVDPESHLGYPRILRGGSWADRASWLRSASRNGRFPGTKRSDIGFRLSRGSG